jgi:hypothetical protein
LLCPPLDLLDLRVSSSDFGVAQVTQRLALGVAGCQCPFAAISHGERGVDLRWLARKVGQVNLTRSEGFDQFAPVFIEGLGLGHFCAKNLVNSSSI